MKVLGQVYNIEIGNQVIASAAGMHGAGKYGAQCGLVEGTLMFMGIYGAEKSIANQNIVEYCYEFAAEFEKKFGSLRCRELRPEGFDPKNPPHLCEEFTKEAVNFSIEYVLRRVYLD